MNAFIGREEAPSEADLAEALGPALPVWRDVVAAVSEACGITGHEWTSYSRKAGWSLRLQVKKRNIVYLSPHRDGFGIAFVLGAKALEEALAIPKLPKAVLTALSEGKKYPEGTGVQLKVVRKASAAYVQAIAAVAGCKARN
ncbi:MAG: DUF3788 family protein [Acidobacteria bacterium]|nr:DUF3788 family protein [Acidobacteriota bacterium]